MVLRLPLSALIQPRRRLELAIYCMSPALQVIAYICDNIACGMHSEATCGVGTLAQQILQVDWHTYVMLIHPALQSFYTCGIMYKMIPRIPNTRYWRDATEYHVMVSTRNLPPPVPLIALQDAIRVFPQLHSGATGHVRCVRC